MERIEMPEKSIILIISSHEDIKKIVQETVREEFAAASSVTKTIKYLTRKDLETKLHISLPTIDKAIKKGTLKAYRIGGRILFKEDEINLTEIPK